MRSAIKIMNEIKGVRIAGTDSEKKAANKIIQFLGKKGVKAKKEYFPILVSDSGTGIIKVKNIIVKGIPYGLTVPYKINGKLICVNSIDEVTNLSNENKNAIILTRERPKMSQFKKLKEIGIKGIITIVRFDGNISSQHLSQHMIKNKSVIPMMDISFDDAIKLRYLTGQKIIIIGNGKTFKTKATNIIVNMKGKKKTNENFIIVGHYDTVPHSPGAADNSGGIGVITEMIEYFHKNPVKRNLTFIMFSGEEWGLWGSRYYCNKHKKELKNIIGGLNVDVAGDVLGVNRGIVTGNERLMHTAKNIADFNGFPINISKDIYSSDNMPFAYNGIPFLNIYRAGGKPSVFIHTRNDKMDYIDEQSFDDIVKFSIVFTEKIGNAERNIIERKIDDDIKKKISVYFNKKGTKIDHITENLPYLKKG